MPPKPHRVLLDRVSGYADEAAAYMRRRRVSRRPFARLYYAERAQRRPRRRLDRRRRAVRRRRPPDRGRRKAPEAMSGASCSIPPSPSASWRGRSPTAAASPRSSPNAAAGSRCRSTSRGSRRSSPAPRRAPACAWSRAPPPTSPTSTASTRPTSSAPPTRPRRRCAGSAASRGRCGRRRPRRCRSSTAPKRFRPSARRRCCASSTSAPAAQGGEIAQFTSSYAEARRQVPIANSEGLMTGDDRTRTRIGAQAVARRGDAVETGAETLGGHRGFELLEDDPAADRRAGRSQGADAARRRAGAVGLDAGRRRRRLRRRPLSRDDGARARGRPHPEGGQRLRRQARRAGRPAAAQRLRRRTIPHEWGSDAIDDEGVPTQKTQVIEDGGLTAYLYDRLTAERDGVPRPATVAARASVTCRSRA